MNILFFPTGPYATNMYIICCKDTSDAVIVDPGVGSFEIVLEAVQQHFLKPTAIWLTHSHWDHIVDAAKIKRELSLPIYVHEEDKGNLEKPGSDKVPMAVPTIEGTAPDYLIQDGDLLTVGTCFFKVIHTPGHTPGGVCFYCEKEKTLVSGDTFYRGLIGSLSLPTSQPERMWPSLDKIAILPPDTIVFPGHGPHTTIKDEPWLLKAKEMGVVHQ
jgi:glyoxylase-like metal-dependent hydrolase (beta-lactamase superfamily II)